MVWATDEAHSLLYLFPRECPRIVIWPTSETTTADREAWIGDTTCRAIAFVEDNWTERVRSTAVYRYLMPPETFEDIDDVGISVSRNTVTPLAMHRLADLPAEMAAAGVELRSLPRLSPLKPVWQTTLHARSIRTRNAQDWDRQAGAIQSQGVPLWS